MFDPGKTPAEEPDDDKPPDDPTGQRDTGPSDPTPTGPGDPKDSQPSGDPAEDSPDLADLTTDHLEHEVESIAARLTAGTCRWLELVGELERRGAWEAWGCLSCAHWLAWRCALTNRVAREHVRVARAIRILPLIHERFASGELSYSKVRALTRVARPETEADLLEIAAVATAAQLEQIVRAHGRVARADENASHADRYVSAFWSDDGTLEISARLSATEGALFLKALEAARDVLAETWEADWREEQEDREMNSARNSYRGSAEPHDPDAAPKGPPRPSKADALAAIAESALAGANAIRPVDAHHRNAVVIHIDAERLASEREATRRAATEAADHETPTTARCHIESGPAICPDTARRIACEAKVELVLDEAKRSTSIGRRSRTVPRAMRRALEARDDNRCSFPGCGRTRFLDAHHIHHWAHGGETSLDNLLLLCRRHHRLIHEGGFELARDASGERRFHRPDGTPLEPAPQTDPVTPAKRTPPPARSKLEPGFGERMRLHDAVLAVLQIDSRAGPAPGAA